MTNDPTPALDSSADLKSAMLHALRLRVENEAVILLKHVDYLASINKRAIARVEALEVELAEARAELDEFEPIDDVEVAIHAQQVLDDLHRRDLYHHPNDEPVTAEAALEALRTVLDGVDAVFGRVADVGGPVEVSDKYGWYRNDDLRAQVAALTAELDEARAELKTEHYRAQRELLLSLWREMEGEQAGDAPGNHLLESGLVAGSIRRDEHIAVMESEVQTVSNERDRLARVLACEVGDAEHAPDGWQRNAHHMWWKRTPDFYIKVLRLSDTYAWEVWDPSNMDVVCDGRAKYALEAMLAADEAARAGEAS